MSAPARAPRTSGRPRTAAARARPSAWTRPRLVASGASHVPTRTGPPRAPFALLIAGLLVGGLCALLALNTAAAAAELRRQSIAQANADAADDVQQLKAELAARRAPAALRSAASALGMVPADHPAFLRIQPDGRASVLGSAQPAAAVLVPAPSPTPTATPTKSATPTKTAGPTKTRTQTGTATPTTSKPPERPVTSAHPTGSHR
jgi:hypothetical protein